MESNCSWTGSGVGVGEGVGVGDGVEETAVGEADGEGVGSDNWGVQPVKRNTKRNSDDKILYFVIAFFAPFWILKWDLLSGRAAYRPGAPRVAHPPGRCGA